VAKWCRVRPQILMACYSKEFTTCSEPRALFYCYFFILESLDQWGDKGRAKVCCCPGRTTTPIPQIGSNRLPHFSVVSECGTQGCDFCLCEMKEKACLPADLLPIQVLKHGYCFFLKILQRFGRAAKTKPPPPWFYKYGLVHYYHSDGKWFWFCYRTLTRI